MGFGGGLIIHGGNLVTFQGSIPCSPILKTQTAIQSLEKHQFCKLTKLCLVNFQNIVIIVLFKRNSQVTRQEISTCQIAKTVYGVRSRK